MTAVPTTMEIIPPIMQPLGSLMMQQLQCGTGAVLQKSYGRQEPNTEVESWLHQICTQLTIQIFLPKVDMHTDCVKLVGQASLGLLSNASKRDI